jgi:hypothetical protein
MVQAVLSLIFFIGGAALLVADIVLNKARVVRSIAWFVFRRGGRS